MMGLSEWWWNIYICGFRRIRCALGNKESWFGWLNCPFGMASDKLRTWHVWHLWVRGFLCFFWVYLRTIWDTAWPKSNKPYSSIIVHSNGNKYLRCGNCARLITQFKFDRLFCRRAFTKIRFEHTHLASITYTYCSFLPWLYTASALRSQFTFALTPARGFRMCVVPEAAHFISLISLESANSAAVHTV